MANKSESDNSGTDDPEVIAATLAKMATAVRAGIRQWENLPELVKAGRLAKERGYSYRLVDPKVINEIGELIQEYGFDADGKIVRVKLEKPDPNLLTEIAALQAELASRRH